MKGKFIVIEGLDGSGKSSLISNLATKFNKVRVKQEPSAYCCKILGQLKDTTSECIQALIMADRFFQMEETRAELEHGFTVIQDRSLLSGVVYGSLENLIAKKEIVNYIKEYKTPDLCFYLKVDPETAHRRVTSRNKALSKYESFQCIKRAFTLFNAASSIFQQNGWVIEEINGEEPETKVFDEVYSRIHKKLYS